MSYQNNQNSQKQAQEIYRRAYNTIWKQYQNPEERRQGNNREKVMHSVVRITMDYAER